MSDDLRRRLKSPEMLLYMMSAALPLAFSTWMALLNNFTVEQAAFTGVEIGILQSVREIPGFMAFAVVFLLFLMREQTLGYLSLVLLGVGTALTGFFPDLTGLLITTFVMSVGFHYFETVRQSLSMQWLSKDEAPVVMGRMISVGSFAALTAFGGLWLALEFAGLGYVPTYVIGGGLTVALTLAAWIWFPRFPEKVEQHKKLFLRKRYWLYYALTFMAGARRQIFVVFAGFLMVEKFGYDAAALTFLFLVNCALNIWFAPLLGKWIRRFGERKILTIEYIGLIGVFLAYAFVENPWVAASLYVIDHLFFSMAIAMKTYFQKIADPADIAPTAGVAFSINHVAAVGIPAAFGLMWMVWPGLVFLAGAAMASVSLVLARLVPEAPEPGREVAWKSPLAAPAE